MIDSCPRTDILCKRSAGMFLPCRRDVRSEAGYTFQGCARRCGWTRFEFPATGQLAEVIRLKAPMRVSLFLSLCVCVSRGTGTRGCDAKTEAISIFAASIAFVSISRDPTHFPQLRDPLAGGVHTAAILHKPTAT